MNYSIPRRYMAKSMCTHDYQTICGSSPNFWESHNYTERLCVLELYSFPSGELRSPDTEP